LVDRVTWEKVQVLLGDSVYRSHSLVYGGEMIACGHCGHPITGEVKVKKAKAGPKEYVYYRCTKYNSAGHPRVRLTEAQLDKQMLALFEKIRIDDDECRDWVHRVLRERAGDVQRESKSRTTELNRQITQIVQQQDRLLNLRLMEEISSVTFASKITFLRDREAKLRLEVEACSRGRAENADIAVKAFELSQNLATKWLKADTAAKRQIIEIVCLNCQLVDVTLVPTIRKPFDVLAEGLISKSSRGDWI